MPTQAWAWHPTSISVLAQQMPSKAIDHRNRAAGKWSALAIDSEILAILQADCAAPALANGWVGSIDASLGRGVVRLAFMQRYINFVG